METTYYAVWRKDGESIPCSTTYKAADVQDAIAGMCELAGVQGTATLVEFEVLEVVGRDTYIPRCSKVAIRPRGSPVPPITKLPAIAAPAVESKSTDEQKYVNYTRAAA